MRASSGNPLSASSQIRNADRFDRNVGVALQRRIDRHEIILARILQAVSGEIDEAGRMRPGGLNLRQKLFESAPHQILIEIGGAGHIEAGRRQRLRDQTGIIGCRRQRSGAILRIADDKCEPRFVRLRPQRGRNEAKLDDNENRREPFFLIHAPPENFSTRAAY